MGEEQRAGQTDDLEGTQGAEQLYFSEATEPIRVCFSPFLSADLLATLGAGVHVVALQSVLDGHLIQGFLNQPQREPVQNFCC